MLSSMFGQQTTQPKQNMYSGGGLTYDPSVYQQGMANSDPYAYTTGWSGLDSLGAGAGITGAIGDPNNPTGFNASRSLQPGDTRNGYEINTLGLNPDGSIKYDPNSWTFQEYKPDGGWLRPAATWAALASGTAGLGSLLTSGAAAAGGAGGLSGMDLAGDAAAGTGNNIMTAGSQLGGAGGLAGTGIPEFAQQPGYGQQFGGQLADASGGTPYTGAVNSAATNPALIESAAQTPGYGVSSAGIGGGAGTGLTGMFQNAVNGIKQIPGVSKVGGNLVTNMLGSVLGGGKEGGVSTLGNLGSLFSNYQQYSNNKDMIDQIKGIYSPTGDYAKYLGEQLARKDAQAGRNSQYGPRLAELMGRLGDSQARALSGLGGYMSSQQGGLNGMVGAGSRLFDSMGGMNGLSKLFQEPLTNNWNLGPNGGPQMPTEDLDNWDLFGG